MKKRIVILMATLLLGCSTTQQTEKELKVFAANYPLSYFAERISGNAKLVEFPAMEGDPAFWEPSTQNVLAMQRSDLILLNGATYEKWQTSVSLPKGKIVDTSKAFEQRYIHMEEAVDHAHGPSGAHSHSGTAFTTWIDLNQAAFQARAIKDALSKQSVSAPEVLDKNFNALFEELRALDTRLNETAQGNGEVPLVASHPVYQYLARRYGLNIKAVMWEPDVYPDETEWAHLQKIVQQHPARWMLWEGEPRPKSVARLKEMGIESIVFDPCGNRPEQGDFLSVMQQNAANLQMVFGEQK